MKWSCFSFFTFNEGGKPQVSTRENMASAIKRFQFTEPTVQKTDCTDDWCMMIYYVAAKNNTNKVILDKHTFYKTSS